MFDGLIEAIVDFFRTVLWGIVEVFLFIIDILWEIVLRIATLNVSDISDLSNWFILISTTTILFIVFKLFKIFIKFFVDEEYREKINLTKTLVMLSLASTLIVAVPIGYAYLCYISSNAIENIEVFIPGEHDLKISNILIQSGRVNMKDTNADLGQEIEMNSSFDINAKDDEGNYKYFPEYSNIFLMIIVAIICFFIFAMTALQIGQRLALLVLKYLMAPIAVASIIDPEDNTFGSWMKMISGDLIMNFMQIYGIYVAMFLCNNATIGKMLGEDAIGVFAKILFFVGCLMAAQEIPTVVASLTGGSGKGIMQSLQDLKSTVGVGRSVAMAGKGVAVGAAVGGIATAGSIWNGAGAVKTATATGFAKGSNVASGVFMAAGSVIGAGGRAATSGIKSRAAGVGSNVASIFNGGVSGAVANRKTATSKANGSIQESATSNANGSIQESATSQAFDDPPTEKQMYAAEKLGINDPSSMSKGELSLAMQEAGADVSYLDGNKSSVPSSDNLMNDAAKYYGIDTTNMSTAEVKETLKSKGYKMADTSTKNLKTIQQGSNSMYRTNLNKKRGFNK